MSVNSVNSILPAQRRTEDRRKKTSPDVKFNADSSIEVPQRPERRTSVVMALGFLPWIAVVFYTAGGWAALNFLAYSIVVFAAGYAIVTVAFPAPVRSQILVLAPAVGVMGISALTAFWLRLGLPVVWTPALWLALAVTGGVALWRDRVHWVKSTVAYGLTLVIFSALICAVYFLPSARNDLVQRRDGSFNWSYTDTQHFHAIAASIKTGGSPPKTPGTVTAELLYHFGPYAPAAAISRLDGLDLGDAVARVTRGASLWALVLSCFVLGTLLSIKANGKKFGGIMSVAGLFFYGSLLALFSDETVNLLHVSRAILFTIPDAVVLGDGGPFVYMLSGHSVLHGLGAITAIMALCLVERDRESAPTWHSVILLALPALAVPVNSVAALYCVGIVGILLFWGRLGETPSWLQMALVFCLFLAAWKIMGYGHATDAAQATLKEHIAWQWWALALWLIVGLGFRIVAFRWISRPWKDPLSALVLASAMGFLAFSFLFQLAEGKERYGIHFLQCIFAIFAFSRLSSRCWQGGERSQMIAEWVRVAKTIMIFLTAAGALIACVALVTHHRTGISHFGLKIILSFIMLSLLAGISMLMKRSRQFSTAGSAVMMGVLMVGFLGWTPTWLRHGMRWVSTDVTYPPGEVRGLRRLGELMSPDERFATNKHSLDLDKLLPPDPRSYGYSALSERPVLLEGYIDRDETQLPWFKTLLHDNDLLFTTTNPETLRNTARMWHVRWLVAQPGTDISLPRPLPAWLVEQQDCGDLRIYRIE
ncbi:MAG: hypothetical protein ACLQVG_08035 [Terriglobia bacterium]